MSFRPTRREWCARIFKLNGTHAIERILTGRIDYRSNLNSENRLMKRFAIMAMLITAFAVSAFAQKDETAAARVPLENYLKGHATGDGEFMKKAFHTEGNMIFVRDGKYMSRSFAEYIAGMSGKPAADEA